MTAGPDALVSTLIQALGDPEITVRVHAGFLLARMGPGARSALPSLLALRQSEDVRDRRMATLTLGSLSHELAEVVPSLLDALHDEDDTVRRLATEALAEMAPARGRVRAS
jgi:HEAT repeat protein